MSKLPNVINLVLGDWSCDGHNMTETFTIRTNLDKKALETAYKQGVKKLKVDISESVACDYEDSTISVEQWKQFADAGMTLEELFIDDSYLLDEAIESVDDFNLSAESFFQLWLFTVKQGNSNFEFSFEKGPETQMNIGGYGLFYA